MCGIKKLPFREIPSFREIPFSLFQKVLKFPEVLKCIKVY